VGSANQDYDKLTDPANPVPSAPVYAARLNGLLKTLATAEGAVQECVKARTELIGALEKMLNANRAALAADQSQLEQLGARRTNIDAKKHDVELAIMSGLTSNDNDQARGEGVVPAPEPDRPEIEALTPPSAHDEPGVDEKEAPKAGVVSPPPAFRSPVQAQESSFQVSSAPGIEILSNLASQYQAVPVSTNGANKRRRIDSGDDFPDLGNDDGIDADVAEMLRKDSLGA